MLIDLLIRTSSHIIILQLLGEDRFSPIDKIKTVGSTYMAAVGLIPDKKMTDDPSTRKHMATLVEFVFAMRDKLKDINDNSYNNFMLRVGKLYSHVYLNLKKEIF